MSFNRLLYDNCEAKKYVNQSQGPGNYNMNTPIICNNCIQKILLFKCKKQVYQ